MKKPYSNILVALLKGVVYKQSSKQLWEDLFSYEHDIKLYFADIYLDVIIDKSEGFAYLKQRAGDTDNEIPKLISKRPLNFHVSLLCVLLRKHLIENDTEGESTRAILSKEEIINMVKPFYNETSNEVKQNDKIESAIKKVVDEGFLRKLKTDDDQYEINRIIKGFINADQIKDYLDRLENSLNQVTNDE